ncbi:MAG: hypothetical protein WEB33_05140, partial [Bacteroidota bacterium]
LKFFFDGRRGQVEVGGPYVGMEFHRSRPVPSRISFYYPVANSVDLSTDYWKRDESLPMAVGLAIGGKTPEWIQKESWSYILSPNKVTFLKTTDSVEWTMTYEFCKNQPAGVVSISLRNRAQEWVSVALYTHLRMSLRTCQTYARKDSSRIGYDPALGAVIARFDDADTDSAAVFVQNVAEQPTEWTTNAEELEVMDNGDSRWPEVGSLSSSRGAERSQKSRGIAAFVFRKSLGPSDSLYVVQVIGSCRGNEVTRKLTTLRHSWVAEIRDYDNFIRAKSEGEAYFKTGDKTVDRSAVWARALIAANAHYLDGQIVPMPCPAEYNFFFTHDLLLTNLGAVQFDLDRVKSNLLYVASMAKDSIIPHAYYWRDAGYKTEYCEPENWNHLWFILAAGSYLRHSLDDSAGTALYPCLMKSVHALLTRLRPNGLMYAYRPDWWDIGHNEGPRAYLTALAVRALREFLFISSFLQKQSRELQRFEEIADTIQQALVDKLWDSTDRYLMNYNAGEKDYHFYAGSLIAVVYNLLDRGHAQDLVSTAAQKLVEDRIGVRIAMPPDFSTDPVIKKFKFAGDEAGPPFSYANGGVWSHGNAWYAMALNNVGEPDRAYDFMKRIMTIDGTANSPNGLPAMFEYRSSDEQSPAFGTIDKPSFLWAGGMYLQALYRILAVDENEWNISIRHTLPSQLDSVSCSITFGGLNTLTTKRAGNNNAQLHVDGTDVPSRILPLDLKGQRHWSMSDDGQGAPVLMEANAIVHSASYDRGKKQLWCEVSSFDGHSTALVVKSKEQPGEFTVDGRVQRQMTTKRSDGNTYSTTLRFAGAGKRQRVILKY